MIDATKYQHIIWDWNGTLVDDSFIFVDIMNDYLSLYGLPEITPEDYKNNFCFPVNNYYKRLGFKLSEKEFKKLSVNFIQKYKKVMFFPSLKKDILSVLKYLKKLHYKQFVVSAQEQGLLRQSVDYYGLTGYFGGSFGLNNNLAVSKKSVAKNFDNTYNISLFVFFLIIRVASNKFLCVCFVRSI